VTVTLVVCVLGGVIGVRQLSRDDKKRWFDRRMYCRRNGQPVLSWIAGTLWPSFLRCGEFKTQNTCE